MKKQLVAALIFLGIVVVTGAAYVSDLTLYGPTWDEFFHRPTGERYLTFLKTWDRAPLAEPENASWFPPVAVTVGAAFLQSQTAARFFPEAYDRFHLGAIFFASLTAGFVFVIGHRLTDRLWVGLLAAALLATHPQFVTHAHINVRDMGLQTLYALTLLLLLLAVQLPRGGVAVIALAGLTGGLATDAKQNGAFLIFIGLAWLLLNARTLGLKRWLGWSALYLAGFVAGFFLFWPYLWDDTGERLKLVWRFLTDPAIISINATFHGTVYWSGKDLPSYYPWAMLTYLTPPVFMLLAWTGAIAVVVRAVRGDVKIALPLVWIFVPLSRFFFPKSAVCYDQIRHILEVLPAMAVLAALMVWMLATALRRVRWGNAAVAVLAVGTLAYNGVVIARYRPHGCAYFNRLAGDGEYVTRSFDVEFWGNVYREAARELNRRHPPHTRYFLAGLGGHIIKEAGLQGDPTDDLNEDFQVAAFMNKQNYLRNSEYAMWLVREKRPTFTIERDGKILFWEFEPHREEYRAATGR